MTVHPVVEASPLPRSEAASLAATPQTPEGYGQPRPPWDPRPLWWHVAQHRRRPGGFSLQGHHHDNYVVPLHEPLASIVREAPGRLGKFRTRQSAVRVLPRVWRETAVLRAVRRSMPDVPRPLFSFGRHALHTFIEGVSLAEVAAAGNPVGDDNLRRIAALFGDLGDVPGEDLPRLPREWRSRTGCDSARFLQNLADFAHRKVYRRNYPRFGTLFRALGIPDDAVERFTREAKRLRPRPYSLLHTDIHRGNLLVRENGDLALVDWELALFGDPLHDLATHVVRMEYTEEERCDLIAYWQREMSERGREDRLEGMEEDFPVYLDFEYAQSIFPDTIRAAEALPLSADEDDFDAAAASVHRALSRARVALALGPVPDHRAVKEALRSWHRARQAGPGRLPAVRRGRRGT
ncbi:aminoglycoside phosphotransferase family protein [Streptomyces marispadix]|uniref:Aminoglycoside phosphotransferase family protein n=1 Tax=Streptomyces marispadix TaxID=2922868 RepID=A0ABS9SXW0_9ACTN|nr:aminoglycoside phosphotransferase family protein [Streptomyces marispadix]MCH6161105.1 aminoglycoside phosphotransferase family protein [Streptomyces marispadix]